MFYAFSFYNDLEASTEEEEVRSSPEDNGRGRGQVCLIPPEIGIVFPALTILVFMQYRAQSLRIAQDRS